MNDLDEALRLHRAGELAKAEQLYRRCLAAEPSNATALRQLGLLAFQAGHPTSALARIRQSLAIEDSAESHFALAVVFAAEPRPEEAMAEYRQALALDPHHVAARNNLALLLIHGGHPLEAERELRAVLSQRPDWAMAWSNLALALLGQSRRDEAIEACERAIHLQPGLAIGHINLGRALLEAGLADKAAFHAQRGAQLQPESAAAHSNLGNVQRALGQHDESRASHQVAVRLAPQDARIRSNLAALLMDVEEYGQAREHLEEARRFSPHDDRTNVLLSQCLRSLGEFTRSNAIIDSALAAQPDSVALLLERGRVQQTLGEIQAAAISLRAATQVDPTSVEAWVELATHHSQELSNQDLETLNQLLAQEQRPGMKSSLHFAMAKLHDRQGQYPQAASHSIEANQIQVELRRRSGKGYDRATHAVFVENLISAFDKSFFERVEIEKRRRQDDSQAPIFIVGMPRSGTTLTEQILAGHPHVEAMGELQLAQKSFMEVMRDADSSPAAFPEKVARLDRRAVEQAAEHYTAKLNRCRKDHSAQRRVVEKLPENFLYLGWLAALFPSAVFVHCRRKIWGTVLSCWMTDFDKVAWANTAEDIHARLDAYEKIGRHWERVLPVELFDFWYEDTVQDLESKARQLVAAAHLPWDDKCLEFQQAKRPIVTASVSQVRQAIYVDSVNRHEHYRPHLPDLFPDE